MFKRTKGLNKMSNYLKLLTAFLPVLVSASYLPYSFDAVDIGNTKLVDSIQETILVQDSNNGIFYLPEVTLNRSNKEVITLENNIADVELIYDALELLKVDALLEEVLFIRNILNQDELGVEERKYFEQTYTMVSRLFSQHVKAHNPEILYVFKNRTSLILDKHSIQYPDDINDYVDNFISNSLLAVFNKPMVRIHFDIVEKRPSSSVGFLSEYYSKKINKLSDMSYVYDSEDVDNNSIVSNVFIDGKSLIVDLNYRGHKKFVSNDLNFIFLPGQISYKYSNDREFSLRLECKFKDISEEVFQAPDVTLVQNRHKYSKTYTQQIVKKLLKSDKCDLDVENIDISEDLETIMALYQESIDPSEVRKKNQFVKEIHVRKNQFKTIPLDVSQILKLERD